MMSLVLVLTLDGKRRCDLKYFCGSCVHREKSHSSDPCWKCLEHPDRRPEYEPVRRVKSMAIGEVMVGKGGVRC